MPHLSGKTPRRRRWLAIVILPALAALIVATAISNSGWTWSGAFCFSARARVDVATRVVKMEVTVIGDRVEVQRGPTFSEDELRWLRDELKEHYPSTALYPSADGVHVPIWKYACEIEWAHGAKRLTRATPIPGI